MREAKIVEENEAQTAKLAELKSENKALLAKVDEIEGDSVREKWEHFRLDAHFSRRQIPEKRTGPVDDSY